MGGNGTKRGFTVGTWYWLGDFDGATFTPTSPDGQWLDGGADFHAAVVWTDPAAADPLASAYSIAWMSNWDYANQIPVTHGYRGQFSLVRRLRLQHVDTVPRLLSTPLAAQDTVFDQTLVGRDQTIMQGSDYAWPAGAGAAACRIDVTLTRIGENWPARVCLSVRKGEGVSTQIAVVPPDNMVSLKRDAGGPNAPDVSAWRQDRSVFCDFSTGTATISLFIDSGSVEVFLNDGAASMSELITAPVTATGLQLSASGGRVTVSNVVVRQMS